jgi:hypothetical protein
MTSGYKVPRARAADHVMQAIGGLQSGITEAIKPHKDAFESFGSTLADFAASQHTCNTQRHEIAAETLAWEKQRWMYASTAELDLRRKEEAREERRMAREDQQWAKEDMREAKRLAVEEECRSREEVREAKRQALEDERVAFEHEMAKLDFEKRRLEAQYEIARRKKELAELTDR